MASRLIFPSSVRSSFWGLDPLELMTFVLSTICLLLALGVHFIKHRVEHSLYS